jgi:hypothetical protein
MPTLAYRLVNVFAEAPLAGNPLCVFEDGRALDDTTMQALARQFNLSETTFILPAATQAVTARVASSANVRDAVRRAPDARHRPRGAQPPARGRRAQAGHEGGHHPRQRRGDVWTLEANAPESRAAAIGRDQLAEMLGLERPACETARCGSTPDLSSSSSLLPRRPTSSAAVRARSCSHVTAGAQATGSGLRLGAAG